MIFPCPQHYKSELSPNHIHSHPYGEFNDQRESSHAHPGYSRGCGFRLRRLGAGPGPAGFAVPVRIKAGDAHLGEGRILPSPVVHDVDRNGCPHVVIGDLHGRVTVALRSNKSEKSVLFDAENPLNDRSGDQLKFHNW